MIVIKQRERDHGLRGAGVGGRCTLGGGAAAGLVAEGAELLADRGALEVRLDLVETLALKGAADVVEAGASAGTGEGEGSFESAGGLHSAPIRPKVLKT